MYVIYRISLLLALKPGCLEHCSLLVYKWITELNLPNDKCSGLIHGLRLSNQSGSLQGSNRNGLSIESKYNQPWNTAIIFALLQCE